MTLSHAPRQRRLIAAKIGMSPLFRPQPSAVCLGFVARVAALRLGHSGRVRVMSAATRLRLTPSEVVAKCRAQPLLARRLMLCFGGRCHGSTLNVPRQIRPSPKSILARDTRHPKAHSLSFWWAHNFLACCSCHLVRIAASVIIAHALSRRAPERDDHRVTRRSPVSFRPCFHPLFMLSQSLRSGRRESTLPPESRRLSGFPDSCAPDPVTETPRADRPRSAPAPDANAADATGRPAKSAICALKHQSVAGQPGGPSIVANPLPEGN
jgi:hypothetical protein